MTFSDIVKELNVKLTYAEIAAGINACIVDPAEHYVLATPWWWAKGKHQPGYSMLEHIYHHAPEGTWMRDFAMRGMAVKCANGNGTDKGEN